MRLPNLLATRKGRLAAFFFLYLTEGIPLGFAAVAIAAQLRRQGVGPAAIGAFVGSLYLPWAFKWAFGPIVDVFAWERLGRRRGWILVTQVLMALTLLSAIFVRLPEQLALFTAIVFVHNVFGATQDVAIDALACGTLAENERGAANGLMFAGAYIGQTVGGSMVLYLTDFTGFQATFGFVAVCILAVTVFVVLPMREPPGPARPVIVGSRWNSALVEVWRFAALSFRSIFGSRAAFVGLFFALLPVGAMSLGLALSSNLAVELGLTDAQFASLTLAQTVAAAACCIVGGFLSDRLGRRKMMVVGVLLLGVPVLLMAWSLHGAGWIMPADVTDPNRPMAPQSVVVTFWVASILYSAINGTIYGVRSAMFMDVTNPAVAATQFTAYMALMNVTIAYSATWQGIAAESWGYPRTMLVDVAMGLLCLGLIPFMHKATVDATRLADDSSPRRARSIAIALAVALAVWLPWQLVQERVGAAQPIVNMFFSLILVASAVFLGAGGAVLSRSAPRLTRLGLATAPLLLLVAGRRFVEPVVGRCAGWIAGAVGRDVPPESVAFALTVLAIAIVLLGAAVMATLAMRSWRDVAREEPTGTAGEPALGR